MNILRFNKHSEYNFKRWLIVNCGLVICFFVLSLLSLLCFYFFDNEFWMDTAVLWSIAGVYAGFWFFVAYVFAHKKRGEVSALIYLIFMILNFITLSGMFLTDIYEYIMLLANYNVGSYVLFLYSQYYISFLVLVLLYALAIDTAYQLYQVNKYNHEPQTT